MATMAKERPPASTVPAILRENHRILAVHRWRTLTSTPASPVLQELHVVDVFLTWTAAGYILGENGDSLSDIVAVTGADVSSRQGTWRSDGVPVRWFQIRSPDWLETERAVSIMERAVEKFNSHVTLKRNNVCIKSSDFVSRIDGVEFHFRPPSKNGVCTRFLPVSEFPLEGSQILLGRERKTSNNIQRPLNVPFSFVPFVPFVRMCNLTALPPPVLPYDMMAREPPIILGGLQAFDVVRVRLLRQLAAVDHCQSLLMTQAEEVAKLPITSNHTGELYLSQQMKQKEFRGKRTVTAVQESLSSVVQSENNVGCRITNLESQEEGKMNTCADKSESCTGLDDVAISRDTETSAVQKSFAVLNEPSPPPRIDKKETSDLLAVGAASHLTRQLTLSISDSKKQSREKKQKEEKFHVISRSTLGMPLMSRDMNTITKSDEQTKDSIRSPVKTCKKQFKNFQGQVRLLTKKTPTAVTSKLGPEFPMALPMLTGQTIMVGSIHVPLTLPSEAPSKLEDWNRK